MRYDIFNSGDYYENVMSNVIADIFSQATTDKNAIMLDIGANIGWFSLLAASHRAEVYAFEPNVINMVRFCESQLLNGWSLAQNLERNNRIHSYLKGVGSEHGKSLSMYKPNPANPGSFTFNQDLAKDHFSKRNVGGQLQKLDGGELPIVTLDALARDQGWLSDKVSRTEIALMKMDVEGMEHVALEGAKKLLRANIIENILMEFNADSPRADLVSQITTLFSCGYKLFKIGGHQGPNVDFTLTSEDPEMVIDDILNRNFGIKGGNVNAWFKVRAKRLAR
jgi:FkbM family methyltransferase